jgi:hypothetical protein
MGLLDTAEATVAHPDAPDLTLRIPSSEQVEARRDEGAPEEDFLAAWDFVSADGLLVETLALTRATVELGDAETRRFAMANLLVLRSYAQLAARYPGARLVAFGPVEREDGLDAVHAVGNFETEGGTRLIFRHVGLMREGQEEAIVAIISINPALMPVRTDAQLFDTYAGRTLASLRFGPAETGDSGPADRGSGEPETGERETGERATGDSGSGDAETDDAEPGGAETGDAERDDPVTESPEKNDVETGGSGTGDRENGPSDAGAAETTEAEIAD